MGNAPKFAAEADLAESDDTAVHYGVRKARNKRNSHRKVGGGLVQFKTADDVYVCVHTSEIVPGALFEHGDEQRCTV